MRKGTRHSAETRLGIRLTKLQKVMPPEEFDRLLASDGTLKWCNSCKSLKPLDKFHASTRYLDGRAWSCKECVAARSAAHYRKKVQDPEWRSELARRAAQWRINNPEQARIKDKDWSLRKLYGITLQQFEEMLGTQRNRCAICRAPFRQAADAHVDHDHRTGVVRGILCSNCNNGLGRFRDSPASLRRAARYLEVSRTRASEATVPRQDALWDEEAVPA